VFAVNIVHPPQNYHAPTRPGHEVGMLHPIPVGRAPREPGTWSPPSHVPRMIAGALADPIRPVANANALKDRAATSLVTRGDSAIDHVSRQPGGGVVPSNPAATIRNDSRPAAYRPPPPAAVVNGTQQPARPMRPPPPPQNLGYPAPAPIQGVHPASPAYQPPYTPAYTPRPSLPPPSPPPVARPMPPPAPHTTPAPPAAASPR
jgi:hypothetical protein